jgi:peptide chain release factor subunit 3
MDIKINIYFKNNENKSINIHHKKIKDIYNEIYEIEKISNDNKDKFKLYRQIKKKDIINIINKIYMKYNNNIINIENINYFPINISFIGHVDAGKSTICGRLLNDLGCIDKNEFKSNDKNCKIYKKENQLYSGLMDINDDERTKGKTIECAKNFFENNNKRFIIIDAPGHNLYLPNMIDGASQSDVAILIVSAKTGEFESGFYKNGKTKEHILISKMLNINKIIICITKMDSVEWNIGRYEDIKKKIIDWIIKIYNIQNIYFVPISGYNGENLINKNNLLNNKSLLDCISDIQYDYTYINSPLKMPIYYIYKNQGYIYLCGKIESGIVVNNMEILIMPHNLQMNIIDLYDINDNNISYALVNDYIKIKIKYNHQKNVDILDILDKGDMICNIDIKCQTYNEFVVKIKMIKKYMLTEQCELIMHNNIQTTKVYVDQIKYKIINNKKIACKYLIENDIGQIKLYTKKIICGEKYNDYNKLGKIILRNNEGTIAHGKIIKIKSFGDIINPYIYKHNYMECDENYDVNDNDELRLYEE